VEQLRINEYRIWGRIERLPDQHYRAIAAASPDAPGTGPDPDDIRSITLDSLDESRVALGRMLYELSGVVTNRGAHVSWMDVR